ncbi:uncharacterized protein Z518_07016 [Rhinocladiella mackenziei CBS 650.93]|uniref:Uncharacterized protein n=1 Tax=Rhinocladiella mackenziei CBS 650.93 TaxID=1442369 RepID=A0A0D2ICC8_9EURO|nr:uncharacterized protein Z518_07016 [Rhinocladiella mackenziei CBS 650.93]KIX03464.1 hypothetical protein Z518_07016 [Rhinocladiella mackenziei CBS 650.93]
MPLPVLDRFSAPARIQRLSILALTTILLIVFFESSFFPKVTVPNLHKDYDRSRPEYYLRWGPFEPMQIPGFVNTGLPGKRSCNTLKYNSTVGVQKSLYLNDDIRQIATALDSHPVVDYPDDMMDDPNVRVTDIVESTWARLSGSSVWLPEQGVYLSVTQVIFCPTRIRSIPKMSFLRGQLFNADWEHLDNYNLTWGGQELNFPLVFDIPAQWEQDGSLYGPENPRIILEDGVKGAEPVVIFDMIAKRSDWKRAMYIFRPFSNYSTILTIRDVERQYTEKNWAPFFVPQEEEVAPSVVRRPNEYIHFVYSFKPLQILKCHLRCGDCEFAYEQSVPEDFMDQHHEDGGSLQGGTNFVPVPLPSSMNVDSKVRVYAAFPRTNIEQHCDGSFDRPEFAVMINIEKQFHLAFASESLDFGNAIPERRAEDDRCDQGRILILNSVAHWNTSNGQDVMSVTFSVNDETVQVARVQGLLSLIRNLPQFADFLKKDGLRKGDDSDPMNLLSSWVGDDVHGCLVEAVLNDTVAAQEITRPKEDKDEELDTSNELMYEIHQEEEEEEAANPKEEESKDVLGPLHQAETEGIPDLEQGPEEDFEGAAGDEQDFEDEDEFEDDPKGKDEDQTFEKDEERRDDSHAKRHLRRHQRQHRRMRP